MKQMKRLFFAVFIAVHVCFVHAQENIEIDPNKRVLLIFLDNSEPYEGSDVPNDEKSSKAGVKAASSVSGNSPRNKMECYSTGGAVTDTCLSAVLGKVGPLVVSGSLLYNLLKVPVHNASKADDRNFVAAIRRLFDGGPWVVRKVKSSKENLKTELYCIIPRDYLDDQEKKSKDFKKDNKKENNTSDITPLEYQLGLRFDHMESVPCGNGNELLHYLEERYDSYTEDNFEILNEHTGADFVDYLPDIFVINADYKNSEFNVPEWSVYISGHGHYAQDIAQMSFDDFSMFLDFLEKKIKTVFLAYLSCFAAGYNAEQVYGELTKQGSAETYPFVIVTQALTDSLIWAACNDFKNGTLISGLRYDLFVHHLLRPVIQYKQALGYIMPQVLYTRLITDIPQIRFPHVPGWFSVTEIDKAVVSITKTMARTRRNPLTVKPYRVEDYEKDPAAILLYADTIPFSVHIETQKMPVMVPMIAGRADHKMKEIRAKNILTEDFFKSQSVMEYGVEKIIFIKRLETKNEELSDVFIYYKFPKLIVKYTVLDEKTGASVQKSGGIKGVNGALAMVEKPYNIPERYRSIDWEFDKALHERFAKKGAVPDIVKRSIEAYKIQTQKLRLSKVNQLLKSLFSDPKFGYADRRALRYLLQQLEKKQTHAFNYVLRIIQALVEGKTEEAVELVNQAYGKSKPVGYDFSLKELQQKRWQDVLFSVVGGQLFDFLDLYSLKRG